MARSSSPKSFGYTLVQHSGFGYASKPGFAQGLEVRALNTRAERNRVERVGGIVYETYDEAREAEYNLCYPEGYGGIYPKFEGTFSTHVIDGLKIAIPKRIVVA